ncbi:uncharacterized protein EV420DRAFT_1748299 [Desarmillaria tabescens]|uniref:C2H2-type domain-containing protein n=1 Tax=Armillaria tabescens TaxID=1929756 RepID=A0AA39N5G2_ARMTA|nr:uncharacterized protein EV420DRAFT_1748299 [Desarmillaria tabescens]KAK0457955.1 hypothetical protein EV420DRAFT_1748299 [Desarmillaria tabescens]
MTTISLPSLEAMFPEHLFRVPPGLRVKGNEPPRLIPSFPPSINGKRKASSSLHVLRPDTNPPSVSFRHIGHSGSSILRRHWPSHTSDSTTTSSEGEGDEDLENTDVPSCRRHVCKICGMYFNRSNSLKIHENTHAGAKRCGGQFNVNSMRRHYRSHLGTDKVGGRLSGSPGAASASDSNSSSHKQEQCVADLEEVEDEPGER